MAEEKLREYAELYVKAYCYLKDRLQNASDEALQYGAGVILTEVLRYMKPSEKVRREVYKSKGIDEELATKKQRYALHKFGLSYIPKSLTKREASEILSRLISAGQGEVNAIIREVEEKYKKK
ncbi:MAG: hypothetical protein ACUVTD_07855 [Nitrososphaerales archaeon]